MSGGGIGHSLLNAARSAATEPASDDGASHPAAGHQVGPNAIIQTRLALIDFEGAGRARALFDNAGMGDWFDRPPDRMVPAERVHCLNAELLSGLGSDAFRSVMIDAGRRTGRYILDNRIPGPAKTLLRALPAGLAARALLKAIRSNAWTFAGKAEVRVTPGHPCIIEIGGNPLPMPGCPWHAAVFETLFSTLLVRPVTVSHRIGDARGRVDRFEVRWRG
ncbi:bacteriochlorophyll 4-vinyl reductase [Hoeflea sp. BAL378]|uniref:bacteriochlorophyll 4-vinyl reductase n=1 Tax=Hoeflea sp. BAL378 TaxID=1547437 RepID=UPI000690BF06|nr:bacteriochlorophyll 4-vinyl reductase [Hoeflea sp. BAL378]